MLTRDIAFDLQCQREAKAEAAPGEWDDRREAYLQELETRYARLTRTTDHTPTVDETGVVAPDRPAAGAPARNQYGTFKVHTASEKQVKAVERLLRERDLSNLTDIQQAAIAPAAKQVQEGALSKKAASAALDVLFNLPYKREDVWNSRQPAARSTAPVASEKQQAFLRTLLSERDHEYGEVQVDTLPKQAASNMITELLQKPKKQVVQAELEAGMYQKATGEIFKVQKAVHGSGRMTAKLLHLEPGDIVDGKQQWSMQFVYQGLASRFVKADEKMPLDKAMEFGALYGMCCNCGRTLTDEKSIADGIGPVCKQRFA